MNSEQLEALELVKKGKNIFLTGSAGTGKSYTLQNIIQWARSQYLEFAVTASTGSAAYLIRGRTIHSYLGIGLGQKSSQELYEYIRSKKPFIATKLRKLNILIIDEISMIDNVLFDKISEFLSLIRKNKRPFGGLQIILSGDFAQLPSITGKYCFLSDTWNNANIKVATLKTLVRQNNDDIFKNMLEELRFGKCTKESLEILKNLSKKEFSHDIIPTILYSLNQDVEKINEKKYKELLLSGAKEKTFKTTYSKNGYSKEWSTSIKIPEFINLCIGAQVVLTWNISQEDGLINGSRGIITGMDKLGPKVKFSSGQEIIIEHFKIVQEDNSDCWVSFMPLKLAYALSIHKSQGMTLDAVQLDLGSSIFEYGQAYTALSRVRDLSSIKILDVKAESFRVHKDVLLFYGQFI